MWSGFFPAHWFSLCWPSAGPAAPSSTFLFAHRTEPVSAAQRHSNRQPTARSDERKKQSTQNVLQQIVDWNNATIPNCPCKHPACPLAPSLIHTSLLSLSTVFSCCLLCSSSCVFSLRRASLSLSRSSRARENSARSWHSFVLLRLVSSSCCLSFLFSVCSSCSASRFCDICSCSVDWTQTDKAIAQIRCLYPHTVLSTIQYYKRPLSQADAVYFLLVSAAYDYFTHLQTCKFVSEACVGLLQSLSFIWDHVHFCLGWGEPLSFFLKILLSQKQLTAQTLGLSAHCTHFSTQGLDQGRIGKLPEGQSNSEGITEG